jgi:predicted O-methyltransferase YrrM
MELYHPQLVSYLESLLPARHPVLQEMERRAAETRFPIVGPLVGQLFYLLTRLTGARRVFELGSGYGYSTAWFALGVRENGGGEVYHVVWDESLSRDARDYLNRMGLAELVRFEVSEAVACLQRTEGPFDIIFNDIDKEMYPASLEAIKPKLRSGGLLLVDNAFRGGMVFDPAEQSAGTEGVRTLTRMLFEVPDFLCSIMPLRDGVLMAYRR